MRKLPLHKPWSYRGKLLWMLLLGCLLATCLSFVFSFLNMRQTVRTEAAERQENAAAIIGMLSEQSALSAEEILRIALPDTLRAEPAPDALTPAQAEALAAAGPLCVQPKPETLPVTYVRCRGEVYRIRDAGETSLPRLVVMRILGTFLIVAVLFGVISIFSAGRAARPVTAFTQAMQQVAAGDYTVRLPEDDNSQIGALMHSFNEMADALQQTDSVQKDFVANISHEFKTPIAAIKGYARLLETPGLSDAERAEYTAVISTQAARLQNIAQTLLRLASLEQRGGAPTLLHTFRLDEQLRQVIAGLSPLWQPKELEWDLDLRELTLTSDEALLAQVWTNILQNAIKFSGDGKTIRVSCYDAGSAVVCIEDHGIGMDEQTRRRVFDRFFQADHSRSQDGVGLGLTLTKRILDLLGCTIRVDSEPGRGSRFTVCVPFDYRNEQT